MKNSYFRSPEKENTSVCANESKTLNNKAYQKLDTEKPLTNSWHSSIMTALMTSRNNPNVKIVTGKVNNINNGFTNKFNNPNTIATTIDVPKLSTDTPPIKLAKSVTKIAVTKILIINPIKNVFNVFQITFDLMSVFLIKFVVNSTSKPTIL